MSSSKDFPNDAAEAEAINTTEAAEAAEATEATEAANSFEFILNIDRQLRAPLSTVLGMIDFLKATHLTNEQRDYIGNMDQAAGQMNQLLDHLVKIVEAQGANYQLKREPFERDAIVHSLQRVLTDGGMTAGEWSMLHLRTTLEQYLEGDLTAIVEILSGMILYVRSVGTSIPLLQMNVTQESGDHLYVRISVLQPHFEASEASVERALGSPSQRQPASNEARSGMHLLLARSLAQAYQSDIEYKIVDEALELTCYVQLYRGHRKEKGSEISTQIPDDLKIDKCILVVEDNALNQLVTKLMLENYGCEVVIVENGRDAVKTFDPGKHHCVLMDIEMPVMDGYEATRVLREQFGASFPIIGLSADAFGSSPEVYLNNGFNDYLTKPVKKERLAMKVHHWTSALTP